jgi:NAD(P)H dehydrogenase (quinone)
MAVKVLVVYSSEGGNTEKLARAVAEGAKAAGAQVTLKRAREAEPADLVRADAVAAGSPVYFGTMSAELKALWDRSVGVRGELAGKVGAAFATAGHPTGGKETTILSILQAMLIHAMLVVGDPLETGGHYGAAGVGAPDAAALREGRALGKRLAEVAARLA